MSTNGARADQLVAKIKEKTTQEERAEIAGYLGETFEGKQINPPRVNPTAAGLVTDLVGLGNLASHEQVAVIKALDR